MKVKPGTEGALPAMSGAEILLSIPDAVNLANLVVKDFAHLPGPHVTPDIMLELARQVQAVLSNDEVHGVVVTHGTDTLEETAFIMSMVLKSTKPVVFVGAMRNASQIGWDGPSNLRSAILTAGSDKMSKSGVLVCMNDVILAGEEATKTHTVALETFQSRDTGPIARIENSQILPLAQRKPWNSYPIPCQLDQRVEIIKLSAGSDALSLRTLSDLGYQGFVIEGLGCGNVPITAMPNLTAVLQKNLPVVICTRCHRGPTSNTYAYEGAAMRLMERGAILSGSLSSHKARLKLMLLLGSGLSLTEIRKAFDVVS